MGPRAPLLGACGGGSEMGREGEMGGGGMVWAFVCCVRNVTRRDGM